MTFDRINRRTHLYMGMFLLPWLFMYGITSYPMNHAPYFDALYDDGVPTRIEEPVEEYHIDIPPGAELRPIAYQILQDVDLAGKGYGAFWRSEGELLIYTTTGFQSPVEVIYDQNDDRLVVVRQRRRWDHVLSGFHATGGYEQERLVNDAWAVVIDLVMAGVLIWVASGLYMWWHIRQLRFWGALAIGGGLLSMGVFLFVL